MHAARIPLTIIGGFLGAGKTTLVNRVLANTAGLRATVLVNDFGAINIDAALIASSNGETVSLANGCVCCSIGDDLTDALIRAVESNPAPDRIIIEASGVSDPWRIAQVGLADPALGLDSVVVLVDAETVRSHAADPYLADTIQRQLLAADYLVLNKADLVDAVGLDATRTWLESLVPVTPVFVTRNADVPLALMIGADLHVNPGGQEARGDREHDCGPRCAIHGNHAPADHQEQFASWKFEQTSMFRAAKLRELLRAPPRGVLRAKGLVATDEMPWGLLQIVGRRGTLGTVQAPSTALSSVVVIGLRDQLPVAELEDAFRSALVNS